MLEESKAPEGDIIVSKFGGSSVANAEQIKKAGKIVKNGPGRKVIVVSAPGRDSSDSEKITDHLINIATEGKHFLQQRKEISAADSLKAVTDKFSVIIRDLGIDGEDIIKGLKADLKKSLPANMKIDFYASRGEHYNSILVARYLNSEGVPAKTLLPEEMGLHVTEDFGNAKVIPISHKHN